MGGHRKQTASLKFPAKELGVLKKRYSNTRTSSTVEEPESERRQEIKEDEVMPSSLSHPFNK